jgi:hypothetical protein
MTAHFRNTVQISKSEIWPETSRADWLHPCHGPAPDLYGIIDYDVWEYLGALWVTKQALLVALELRWEDDVDPSAPLEEPPLRGNTLQTYKWAIDPHSLRCCNYIFPLRHAKESVWNTQVQQTILEETVRILTTTTVGGYNYASQESH